MAKYRNWNKETREFCYFENGRYYYQDCPEKNDYYRTNFILKFWINAQRYLFKNKFNQEIYIGSVLEGIAFGSKVKVIIEEDDFGIVHVNCIECKSTENSKNLNNIDILLCYNLKVLEDKLMKDE